MLKKGDKKLIKAWTFYDWANSVYALVISTTIFPMYYESVTNQQGGLVKFLGTTWNNTAIYTYTLGFSFLVIAIISPLLSGIADYTGNKKRFMQVFCVMGSLSVMSLYFFKGQENIWIGLIFTILASIGFWGSLVFYNAYLPEVAEPKDQDRVSARGYILGYLGSVLLLAFNLSMVMKPELYGIIDATMPARISFLTVGFWWLGFAQVTFRKLPNNPYKKKPERDFIFKGYMELKMVLRDIKKQTQLKILLSSFFMYSLGVQTVILLATTFGIKDLGLEQSNLIITILLIQLVGVIGAYAFSRISEKIGNIKALKITILIWTIACFGAFMLHREDPDVYLKFYALGGFIGLVLGAIQTLSRSTYSKLIPDDTEDHATYFSFYDVLEKVAIVLGMVLAGLVTTYTHSLRLFILILAIFFVAGFIILSFMKKTKYVK
jgi:UMF1 family MFS transporter